MKNTIFSSPYIFHNNYKYPSKLEFGSPITNNGNFLIEEKEKQNRYEDFVSKLLDENKKLLDLVDFQKEEILHLHGYLKEMKKLKKLADVKFTEDQRNDLNLEESLLSRNLENKYTVIFNDLNDKNQFLLIENDKLERNNKVYLNKINELLQENEKIQNSKENNHFLQNNEEVSNPKYHKIMDLLTEMGEKEKNKDDLIFKVLDLESKVHQLLMENEKLHKFIQDLKY